MRSLASLPNASVERMIGIYTGQRTYSFDGVDVFPVEEFLSRLFKGEIF